MKLKDLIYEQVLEEDSYTIRQEPVRNVFRASEAGDCKRVLWMRKEGNPEVREYDNEETRARVLMLLGDGRMHQDRLTGLLSKSPRVQITNIESDWILLSGDIVITGHPDLVVHYYESDDKEGLEKCVVDVKGISTSYCRKLEDENLDMLKAINPTGRKAIPQLRLYMKMADATLGKIIIKDKNTSALFEFTIERDKEKEDKIIEKFQEIYKDCMRGRMTDCDFLKGDKRCNYCPYPKDCGRL